MKAIQIDQTNKDAETAIHSLKVVEKPIPKPGPGQVLVKIEAAPCNPSDILFLQGSYGVKKTLPAVPGWEGAGTVVESGGGLLPWWLKGKKVACGGQSNNDGTWAEYYVADAKGCIPLKNTIPFEQGATLIINPLTAIGMVDKAKKGGHRAIIQTAACSQVGRMVQTLCRKHGLPLINIVRRDEQVQEVRSAGEKWVLSSGEQGFELKLKALAEQVNATIAFEAVAGSMTGTILNAMPDSSRVLVYGALSEKPCAGISPLSLIFEKKHVEGFWLTEWLKSSSFLQTYQSTQLIQTLMEQDLFTTKIREKVGFDEWKNALIEYHREMTAGKVILKCN